MSFKIYGFALTVCRLCFVTLGVVSSLRAQPNQITMTPIAFYGLGNDQMVRFSMYTNYPASNFDVEVATKPQPQATVQLARSASIQIVAVEKIWGHHAGEKVVRPLTAADLQYLETFLTTHRASGSTLPPALSKSPAMAFERVTYRTNQEGHRQADVDRKEFYTLSEAAERNFIKEFIGFSG